MIPELAGINPKTVTLGFNEYQNTQQDENSLAEIVAQYYKTDHSTVWIEAEHFGADGQNTSIQNTIEGMLTYGFPQVLKNQS